MRNTITLLSLFFILQQQQCFALTCTWMGGTNNDWNTANNWSTGTVPTSSDDVIINSGQVNIFSGASGICNNLTKGGFLSSLVVAPGGTLKILGNLTFNSGTISGEVSMTGSSLQSILGSTPLTLTNLNITNPQGVQMDGNNVKLSGNLNLQGNIYTNGRTLEVGSITTNNGAFVVTGNNLGASASSGGLVVNVAAGAGVSFPVGPSSGNYSPVKITNTAGPTEKFTVRVTDTGISQNAVSNTWSIEEATPGGNTATITLEWSQGAEGGTFDRAACSIYGVNGGSIVYTGYLPQVGTASSVGSGVWAQTLTGVTSFGEWAVNNNTGVLPITLLRFSVERTEAQQALISWTIDVESNPAFFEVEKSRDGIKFVAVHKLLAKNDLTYAVEIPLDPWLNYYRLKMADTEGKVTYSKIRALDGTGIDHIQVFPNPCNLSQRFNLAVGEAGQYQINWHDQNGRNLFFQELQLEKGVNQVSLPAGRLPPGGYLFSATHPNGERSVLKLVIE